MDRGGSFTLRPGHFFVREELVTTALVVVPSAGHTRRDHPESASRLDAVMQLLEQADVLPELYHLPLSPATLDQVQRVHDAAMVDAVRQAVIGGRRQLDADTYITPTSYQDALNAAGGCIAAVDALFEGRADNALALVRPPGHHAESHRPGGFCLFNNAAIAVRHAQRVHGASKVLVIDFDVHHGNGTQQIFYDDASVLFVSTHLYGRFFYPGSGGPRETGVGKGSGYTLNVPLPANVGDVGYRQIVDELIRPRSQEFQPELVVVSIGFDAHWRDPLAYGGLSLQGYARLSQLVLEMAAQLCHGRVLFILEGGYLRDALAYGVLNLVYALLGKDDMQDPLGPLPEAEANLTALLAGLKTIHSKPLS